MYYYTYKVTNLLDGKYYIGVHTHQTPFDPNYYGSGVRIKNAVEKYGKHNFKIEVLKYHENAKDAYDYEKSVLTEDLLEDALCYNLNVGGHGGSKPGHVKDKTWHNSPKSRETKDKISAALTGKSHLTDEGREKIRKALRGNANAKGMTYSHTEEAREKISEARTGMQFSESHKLRISSSRKGLGTGSSNAMAKEENRKKVAMSKLGRKLLVHPNTGCRKLVNPNSPLWQELLAEGFISKTSNGRT